jgi:succinate-acetate transporter protein
MQLLKVFFFGIGLFYGGLCQFIAGIQNGKHIRNHRAIRLWSILDGYYMDGIMAFGFLEPYGNTPQDLIDLRNGFGIYNLAWAKFSFTMLVCCHSSTIALMDLFPFVTLTTFTISQSMEANLFIFNYTSRKPYSTF